MKTLLNKIKIFLQKNVTTIITVFFQLFISITCFQVLFFGIEVWFNCPIYFTEIATQSAWETVEMFRQKYFCLGYVAPHPTDINLRNVHVIKPTFCDNLGSESQISIENSAKAFNNHVVTNSYFWSICGVTVFVIYLVLKK